MCAHGGTAATAWCGAITLCPFHLQGIQFVKHLLQLDSAAKQDAEISIYCGRFDEAEALYRKLDRMDLVIDMRMRFGEWFTVREASMCSDVASSTTKSMCSE